MIARVSTAARMDSHRWKDAAWHQLQIENARQKSGFPGVLVDEDRDETFKTLQRLHLARHAVTVSFRPTINKRRFGCRLA